MTKFQRDSSIKNHINHYHFKNIYIRLKTKTYQILKLIIKSLFSIDVEI